MLDLPTIRSITDALVEALLVDPIVGFHFRHVDREHLLEREFEHAARIFDHDVEYLGRDLAAAHRPHRIFGGQFDRRMKLLADTLHAASISLEARERWIAHDRALRARIVAGECNA